MGLIRGRDSNCNAITTEASARPLGSSGARMALDSYPNLGEKEQGFDQSLVMDIIFGEAALLGLSSPLRQIWGPSNTCGLWGIQVGPGQHPLQQHMIHIALFITFFHFTVDLEDCFTSVHK